MSSLRDLALQLGNLLQANNVKIGEARDACNNEHPDVRKALTYIESFIISAGHTKLNVDSVKYLERLRVLIRRPYVVDQSSFGLCMIVSFLITTIYQNPMAFAEFAVQLLQEGKGYIGSKFIMPDLEFRNFDFTKIFKALTEKNKRPYPEADLIIQGAIQDYDNKYLDFDFTAGVLADLSEGDYAGVKLPDWFNQTKLFKNAKYIEIDQADVVKQFVSVKQNRYVILSHYSNGDIDNLINKNADSGRHVCLISPNNPSLVKDDMFYLTVLNWGEAVYVEISKDNFSKAVIGYIVIN